MPRPPRLYSLPEAPAPGAESKLGAAPGLVDFADILRVIWRGKYAIAAFTLVASVLGYLVQSQIPRIYAANAQIMLDTREGRVLTVEQVVANITVNDAAVASEISMLQSTDLLNQVIDAMNFTEIDEFSADLMRPPLYKRLFQRLRAAMTGGGGENSAEATIDSPARPTPGQLMNAVRQQLIVRQEGISYVINIGFRSRDPELAARTANTLVQTYIGRQHDERLEATRRATIWLEGRIADLRQDVERAESAVLRQRADNLTLGQGGIDVAAQQIVELSRELSDARAQRVAAEAEYTRLTEMLAEEGMSAAAEIISTPLAINLRAELASLKQTARQIEIRYGANHPEIQRIRAEVAAVEDGLLDEVSARRATVSNETDVARGREQALEEGLRAFERRVLAISNASIETNQLEREAEAVRTVYESMLMRLYETRAQEALIRADVRIVSLANIPESPISPRAKLILMMSAFIGGTIGLGAVFLRELVYDVFQSSGDVETMLGIPVLASLPWRRRLRGGRILDRLMTESTSDLAERFRQLRTSLLYKRDGNSPHSVMITSSVRGEGKTTTALGLALVSSWAGRSTIVIDADLRNPSLAGHLGRPVDQDIVSVLRASSRIEDAVQTDPRGFDILPCAQAISNGANRDMLSARTFGELIRELCERYDIVLVDAPPTLEVADAHVIGQAVDTCVYLVRAKRTERKAVRRGVVALSELGVNIAGIVLTMGPASER